MISAIIYTVIGFVLGMSLGVIASQQEKLKHEEETREYKITIAKDKAELDFFKLENERLRNERNRYKDKLEEKNNE